MTDLKGKVVIRFDGPPSHDSGRFIEVERDGASIRYGEWVQEREDWLLVLPIEPSIETLKELVLANQNAAMNEMARAKDAEARLAKALEVLEWYAKVPPAYNSPAREALKEIKMGTVDKGGVNDPPTSPRPAIVVKPQAPRPRVAEGYQPTHGAGPGSPPKGGSALGRAKPPTSTRLAIDGFEQCLRDYDAIEAELFPEGVVFASWTTVANTRRWIEETILPQLKAGEGPTMDAVEILRRRYIKTPEDANAHALEREITNLEVEIHSLKAALESTGNAMNVLEIKERESKLATAQRLLALAIAYMEHEIPERPDHDCGNPDSGCDGDCVNFAQFCNDLLEMKGAC